MKKCPGQKKFNKLLLEAAAEGSSHDLLDALGQGADINTRDEDGWTPLQLALNNHHWYTADLLVQHGADTHAADDEGTTVVMLAAEHDYLDDIPPTPEDIEARDEDGEDALMYAARAGREKSLRKLLAAGANPRNVDNSGQTALHHAAAGGHADCIYHLLKAGAPVNAVEQDYQMTALHFAVQGRHDRCVQQLLRHGADSLCANFVGISPLSLAVEEGLVECLRLILEATPELPQDVLDKVTQDAVEEGQTECLRLLLRRGGNPAVCNEKGMPLLCQAAFFGQVDCLELLLEHGVDINETDAQGRTAHYHATRTGRTACVHFLLEHGATPCPPEGPLRKLSKLSRSLTSKLAAQVQEFDDIDEYGQTPLMLAAAQGRTDLVKRLLKSGADVDATSDFGWTALHHAVFQGHEEITRILLDADWPEPDENGDDDDEPEVDPPLLIAVERGHATCLRLLLEYAEVDDALRARIICHAAAHGRTACMEELMVSASDLECRFNNRTPLLHAAAAGRCDSLRYLLSKGADLHAKTDYNLGALHLAARGRQLGMVKLLLELGIPADAHPALYTPLMGAAEGGSADCVQLLLEHGADPNETGDENWPALMYAARGTNAECVQLLLQAGAKPNKRNACKDTPLSHAVYHNLPENVELLLRHKARPYLKDSSDETALDTAIRHGYTECIHLLAECTIPEKKRKDYFFPALQEALEKGNLALAEYLIAQGADPHAVDDSGHYHLLHAARSGNPACVRFLLELGLPVETKQGSGIPLHWAARSGSVECLRVLLGAGANVNKIDMFHHSPLHEALEKNHAECARFLLEHGADPEAESFPGFTPLYLAAARSPECLKLILSHNVRINTQGEDGVTPLMRCAEYGIPACAEILLHHGADPHLLDSEGHTALDIARKRGNTGIARILRHSMEHIAS